MNFPNLGSGVERRIQKRHLRIQRWPNLPGILYDDEVETGSSPKRIIEVEAGTLIKYSKACIDDKEDILLRGQPCDFMQLNP